MCIAASAAINQESAGVGMTGMKSVNVRIVGTLVKGWRSKFEGRCWNELTYVVAASRGAAL